MKANGKQEKQGASSPLSGKGFVYILKDDHFKRGVKIGRAHDVGKRMKSMRTANPWLSVYIKVETSKWMELEKAVHNVIKLVAKTKQVKDSEFYLIEPEKAKTQLARLIARRGGNEGAYGGILHFFNKRRPCVKDSKWRQPLEAAGIAFDAKDFVVDWAAARNPL